MTILAAIAAGVFVPTVAVITFGAWRARRERRRRNAIVRSIRRHHR